MNEEEYLKLFNQDKVENLNEKTQNESWQKLNEVQKDSQIHINENINDGWNSLDIQFETRINGISQNNIQQLQPNSRRHKNIGQNLNGLDVFLEEDDLREVVKQPKVEQVHTSIVENINNTDIVSIEMFESMNTNALLTLANKKVQSLNSANATNIEQEIKVTYLNS